MTLIDNSQLRLIDSEIRGCGDIGLLVEDSTAQLSRAEISDCTVAGIVVDGHANALNCQGGRLANNVVGIILMSGSANLANVEIEESDTGILLSRKHLLNHQITGDSPIFLEASGVSVTAEVRAIQFLSPGSCRITEDCKLEDPAGGDLAFSSDLERENREDRVIIRVKRE